MAGFFHPYYLTMLAPPVAALVGMSAAELWRLWRRRRWLATLALLVAVAATLMLQVQTAQAYLRPVWWLPVVFGLAAIGAALLVVARRKMDILARAGFACLVAAVLITPALWSGLTVLRSSGNQSLPASYDGQSSGPANSGGRAFGGKMQVTLYDCAPTS